jgi:hypothetical protein
LATKVPRSPGQAQRHRAVVGGAGGRGRTRTHDHKATREAAMAAFAKIWPREYWSVFG